MKTAKDYFESGPAVVWSSHQQAQAQQGEAFFESLVRIGYNAAPRPQRLPAPDAVLTTADVAALLQLPKKTIDAFCRQERIAGAEKLGKHWRIPGWGVRPEGSPRFVAVTA